MIKITFKHLILFSLLALLLACGGNEAPQGFQQNQPAKFELTAITEGYGAMDDAWNSVDSGAFNDRLQLAVDDSGDSFEVASYGFADVLADPGAPLAEMVRTDLAGLLRRLIDTNTYYKEKRAVGSFYQADAGTYTRDFYAFMDKFSTDGVQVPQDYLSGLVDKVVHYIIYSVPTDGQNQPDKAWLNTKVADFVDNTLQDEDFNTDFTDITKLATQVLLETDYPVWVDGSGVPQKYADINPAVHTNLDLGNAVKGTNDLIAWLNRIVHNPVTRESLHKMLLGLDNILIPNPEGQLALKLRTLVENLESYFTIGGSVYTADARYNEDSAARLSNAEMGALIRDASPLLQQLFVRSDRPNAMIVDQPGKPSVYPLDLMVANLRSIGFNPDTINVEGSIDDLLRHDLWGRDRVNDPAAYPTSMLESLLFLTQATANHGWKDAGNLGALPPQYTDSRVSHPQGAYAEELTLNDSLYSIRIVRTAGTFGVYELAFQSTNGNHLYRTRTPFTLSEVDGLYTGTVTGNDKDYRFFYDQNYGVLQFLAGPGPGDLGAPDGGNPNGQSLGLNQYHAYAPNGLHETQLAGFTMGWGVRACFKGEGPYYYADPDAQSVGVNGDTYYKYMRPDGKIYALVSADRTRYLYPTDEGDVPDLDPGTPLINGQPQRDNRYKAQWHSDYYISHFSHINRDGSSVEHFFTIDNSNGKTEIKEITGNPSANAGRLNYSELVAESEPKRACATKEEAFFRNFQWVMNEKKMVIVLPMYMDTGTRGGIKGAVYEVQECNGWSGLANLRRFKANHVWAKQGADGLSTIPGDYRFEVVSVPDAGQEASLAADVIYNKNIDCGSATPAIVGHNLPALYRLAFPLSPEKNRGNGITDKILGSKEFEISDANWQNRNAFVSILFSLLAGLRDYTPAYDPGSRPGINSGMRTFLNQTAIWIKPLFYYNHANQGGVDQKAPFNSCIPRVYGIYDTNGDGIDDRPVNEYLYVQQGAPLTSSADFYAVWSDELLDFIGTSPYYFGSAAEQRFYQPAVMKTFLNVMIDSDLTNPQKRCDGVLPLVTQSTALTNLFKLLLDPSEKVLPLEQIMTAIKFTKGPMTAFNESPASGKGMVYPNWMFATGVNATRDEFGVYTQYTGVRDEDIILDDILDWIVGHDAINGQGGEGIADYPDKQARLASDPNATKQPWEDFNDTVDTLADLLYESSPYSISPNLLSVIDRVFARDQLYTTEEISGLVYSLGKLCGYYDANQNQWVYQGQTGFADMYNMLVLRVPAMNDVVTAKEVDPLGPAAGVPGNYVWGDHYYAQVELLSNMTGPDGLVEYLLNTVTAPQDWGTILYDLNRFMAGRDISSPQSELWPTLSQLLRDMGKAVGETRNGDLLGKVLKQYGFQVN